MAPVATTVKESDGSWKKRFLKINFKKISKFNNKTSESGVLICDLVVIIVRESGGFMIFSRFS